MTVSHPHSRLIHTSVALLLLCLGFTCASLHAQSTPLQVRFVTFNVDFNNTNTEVRDDVQFTAPSADIMMFQEAKNVTINNFLGSAWTVYQVVDQGDARRGSALAVRNSVVPAVLATGIVKAVEAGDADMLDRYIVWADVRLANNRHLRIMSLHLPPQRLEYLQPPMVDSFVTFANSSPHPVVAGADWNFTVNNDPYDIRTRTGLVPRGVGIDGFYRNNTVVKLVSVTELVSLNVASDHDPVQMITNVEAPTSEVQGWSLY